MFVAGLPLLGQIQPPAPCRDVTYVDATQEQRHPRELPQLEGIVSNASGVRMTGACVAVFSEERMLIAVVQADEDGRFQVPEVDPGFYRLVVRAESLCPASVRVRIVKRKIIKRSLQVHMQAAGYGCGSNAPKSSRLVTPS